MELYKNILGVFRSMVFSFSHTLEFLKFPCVIDFLYIFIVQAPFCLLPVWVRQTYLFCKS